MLALVIYIFCVHITKVVHILVVLIWKVVDTLVHTADRHRQVVHILVRHTRFSPLWCTLVLPTGGTHFGVKPKWYTFWCDTHVVHTAVVHWCYTQVVHILVLHTGGAQW